MKLFTGNFNKSLYGLKQAPRVWYNCFSFHKFTVDLIHSTTDNSMFIYKCGYHSASVLLYLDDIIFHDF